jgi:hypothetical protein
MSDFQLARVERDIGDLKGMLIGLTRRADRQSEGVSIQRRLAGVIAAFALAHGQYNVSPDEIARKLCGLHSPEGKFAEKALANPAAATVPGWAAELVGRGVYNGLFSALAPLSIYAQLTERGLSVDMSGKADIRLPGHVPATPPPSPFVGEGQAIPVRRIGLVGVTLDLFKTATITTLTSELANRSTPAAVPVFERLLAEDTRLAIDAALLGDAAASPVRPAGLLNGVVPLVASGATSKAEAIAEDLSALAGAIAPAADPVFVMDAAEDTAALLFCPGAASLPILISDALPSARIIALDAGAFATAAENGTFDIATAATIEERDDPTVTDVLTGKPVRSTFQTDSLGIRLIEDIGWAMRAPGKVAWMDSVTW